MLGTLFLIIDVNTEDQRILKSMMNFVLLNYFQLYISTLPCTICEIISSME